MKRTAILAALGAAIILGAFLYLGRSPAPEMASLETEESPEPAASLSLPDLDGRQVSLSSFRGRPVLLTFWATWCGPCLDELPDLKKLHETYKAKGFTVLAVSMDEDPKDVPPFVKEHGVPYPILLGGGRPPEGYDFPGIPAAFLISPDGMIVRRYLGQEDYAALAADVEGLLAPRR